jgi:hypothetical protein
MVTADDSFEQIIEAAKSGKVALLPEKVSLDIPRQGRRYHTAAAELAEQGDIKAVTFLLDNGADVEYAIMGAIIGSANNIKEYILEEYGDVEPVYILRASVIKSCAEYKNKAMLLPQDPQVQLIAYREYYEVVRRLHTDHMQALQSTLPEDITQATTWLLRGLAYAGDARNVLSMVNHDLSNSTLLEAVEGGHVNLAVQLVNQANGSIDLVAESIAYVGNNTLLRVLLDNNPESISYAIRGAAQARRIDLVDELHTRAERNSSPEFLATMMTFAATGAGKSEDLEWIELFTNKFIERYPNIKTDLQDPDILNWVLESKEKARRVVSQIQDPELYKVVAENTVRFYNDLEPSLAEQHRLLTLNPAPKRGEFSYYESYIMTSPEQYSGALCLLARFEYNKLESSYANLPTLPQLMWIVILGHVFGLPNDNSLTSFSKKVSEVKRLTLFAENGTDEEKAQDASSSAGPSA